MKKIRNQYPKFWALALMVLSMLFVCQTLWASGHIDMEAARREGKVTIYSSISRKDVTILSKAFKKTYPWINVEIYRAGKVKLAQRIVTEARAGKHRFDVLLSSAFATLEIKLQKLLAKYESPQRKHYRRKLKDPEGYWTAGQINVMSLGYNTELVKRDEVPKRWSDLLNPKWKGKIAINANRPEWYVGLLQIMGREKGLKYMRSLAALGTIPGRSATLTRQFLAAGEYPLYANAAAGNMEQFIKKGAPVDWARMDVLPTYPILVSVSSHTKFPNTARLMADFLLAEEGQKLFRKVQRIPARTGIDPDPPRLTRDQNIFYIDIGPMAGKGDEIDAEFRKTFSLR
ncbi:MAG: ABC transporter substrate-binding protein [Candidatus Binatia bacterium]